MELYKQLDAYQKAYSLAIEVYKQTRTMPREERYGITDQLRRAAMSVPANIAEGYARKATPQEYGRFLKMSLGSCNELKVWLDFCKDLELLPLTWCEQMYEGYCLVAKLIGGILRSLRQSPKPPTPNA